MPISTQTDVLIVCADGGRNTVRHALDIGFPGKPMDVRDVVADVTLTGRLQEPWHRFREGHMDRQTSLCPLAGTDIFQIQGPLPMEGSVDLSAEGAHRVRYKAFGAR